MHRLQSRCDHWCKAAIGHGRVMILVPYALDELTRRRHMQPSSIERKDRLHQTFIVALDFLDDERREPDRWEEECLAYALGALACGMYLVAEVELAAFARPISERSPAVLAAGQQDLQSSLMGTR